MLGGVALAVIGMLALASGSGQLDDLGTVLLAAVVTAGGIGLLLGPWAVGIMRVAGEERRERIRSEERAELAAQLHDSVLQTLVLIQRSAPSRPTEAVALARRQERELRSWLYGDAARQPDGPATLGAALEVMAADVEVHHGVEIELVTVGDRPLDDATAALVAATREAVVNAAKHAGVPSVDCYAETDVGSSRVFVRDRGRGFEPTEVPEDRRGISDSIQGRLTRAGGRATVSSTPGEGTEVTLELRR
jgi:signal transduction histidine kinase